MNNADKTDTRTADPSDRATEYEAIERDALIAHARRVIPITERPVLGCFSCKGITQHDAKATCEYFAPCVSDWSKEQKMKRINGHVLV